MPKLKKRLFIIPAVIGTVFALLYLFPFWQDLEFGVYDAFLHLKAAPREDPSIVHLDVNDEAILRSGAWPWPRSLMARGLEALAEFGASYAVFDIEYLEKSPMSVDRAYLDETLRIRFKDGFDGISSGVSELFGAIASKSIPLSDAKEYANDLGAIVDETREDLYSRTKLVAVENDTYLGKAMRLFGKAFSTLNMQLDPVPTVSDELRGIARDRFSYPGVEDRSGRKFADVDFLVPIPEISGMAAGGGFTNVERDSDGKLRRIRLFEQIDGKYYAQLAMRPLLDFFGNPKVLLEAKRTTLLGADVRGRKQDIAIPLDDGGFMLLDWPKKAYEDSYGEHISFFRLVEYRANEESLVSRLRSLASSEVWGLVPGANPVSPALAAWDGAEVLRVAALESGAAADKDAYLSAKLAFVDAAKGFLSGDHAKKAVALLDAAKAKDDAENATLYDQLRDKFSNGVKAASDIFAETETGPSGRVTLSGKLRGKMCFIGWTASSTSDLGVNPFQKKYVNVGTHSTVVNTVLQGKFLESTPLWISSLASMLLAAALIALIARMRTSLQLVTGFAFVLLVISSGIAVFATTGVYVALLSPALASLVAFIVYSLVNFIVSEREKSFLRKAFSTYLSADVIDEIVADPSSLKLGGQKKWITAMFTDIRGFSTVSEQLDPEQLVKLLNLYLSAMSDIILEDKGTIDKFEGDAIISFFGAPLSFPAHARAACVSAIRMKRTEADLNVRFLAEGLSPTPLLTRLGINTGDMVVGNMGTEHKMDYTIMGNAVNLAARLEGVNKQYGSWILCSDATKSEAGEDIVMRPFDKVRVVGINTPVQLYEVVGMSGELEADAVEKIDRYLESKAVFDARDWKKAETMFTTLCERFPDDGPSRYYLKKSGEFGKKAPLDSWDGVFNLSEK